MRDNFQQKDGLLSRIELIAKLEEGSVTAFEKRINASKGVISRAIAKGTDIQSKWIQVIAENYPHYSAEWLLTGRGNMEKEEDNIEISPIFHSKTIEKRHEKQAVNLYSFEASAGLRELFDNKGDNILDTIIIPNLPRCDGAIHIVGDSMMPILKSGDIILYKEVFPNMDSILFGEMYLVSVVMEEGVYLTVVKYIRRSKRNGYITLASENPLHDDTDVDFRRVNAMALVQASIRINSMM